MAQSWQDRRAWQLLTPVCECRVHREAGLLASASTSAPQQLSNLLHGLHLAEQVERPLLLCLVLLKQQSASALGSSTSPQILLVEHSWTRRAVGCLIQACQHLIAAARQPSQHLSTQWQQSRVPCRRWCWGSLSCAGCLPALAWQRACCSTVSQAPHSRSCSSPATSSSAGCSSTTQSSSSSEPFFTWAAVTWAGTATWGCLPGQSGCWRLPAACLP